MCDSASLREQFSSCKDQIADGWVVLGEGDDGDDGRDLYMVLRGPDGKLYEQSASCCSCYGIDDQWDPVEATVESIRKTADGFLNAYGEPDEPRVPPRYYANRYAGAMAALKAIEDGK